MIVAIVQARTGSTRLPGKVLMDICGESMVERVLKAASSAERVDSAVAAIPDTVEDDDLAEKITSLGFPVFRGSACDVLDRYWQAALKSGMKSGDHIVRITADCPLMDPRLIDRVIQSHIEIGADYSSNVRPPTFPDGLDIEVFTFDALESAAKSARRPSEREHVTPAIFDSAVISYNLTHFEDLSDIRMTVDHEDDLDFVREFVRNFGEVSLDTVRSCVQKITDTRDHQRNEGYLKSLRQEAQ
jgi:spore coat polysaccharide biosynthesis protein SpsF (cytidylyltransferase family)